MIDVDWGRLIDDLKSRGVLLADIAREIDCSMGSLSDLRNGGIQEPKFSRGTALIALHARYCHVPPVRQK